jgi:glutamate carboxypeptidase
MEEQLRDYFRQHHERLMDDIADYVLLETPTSDPVACDHLASRIEKDLQALGADIKRFADTPRPVYASFSAKTDIVLVFHHDTVWPLGSFPEPRRTKQAWYGPGIFDMKANLPLLIHLCAFLREYAPEVLARIRVLSSPDEEVMGPQSRTHIPVLAEDCTWALVFEPPRPDGLFKWQRKGLARMRVVFEGIATHTGNHYSEGVSALAAASRWLLSAEDLSELERGLTINVGVLQGGSAVNTRPASAIAGVDIRFDSEADWQAVKPQLLALGADEKFPPRFEIEAEVPPLHAEHGDWSKLQAVCKQLGLPFGLGKAGGASDGSNIAPRGVKVFDGLGVPGAGEHAINEHIRVAELEDTFVRNGLFICALCANPT